MRAYPQHYEAGDLDLRLRVRFEPAHGGAVELPDAHPVAGSRGTWVFAVDNTATDLPAGAVLNVTRFDCQFAFEFQADDPQRRDHATLESSSSARLRLLVGRESVSLFSVVVESGTLARGDRFEVRLGDRRGGGCGSEVFWSATIGQLLLSVDADGSGRFIGVAGNPHEIVVAPHPKPRLLRLLGPSVAAVDEPFDLHVQLFERNGNPCVDFAGRVSLRSDAAVQGSDAAVQGLPPEVELTPADGGVVIIPDVRLSRTGVFRLRATCDAAGLRGCCNPILVEDTPSARVYWGDVHAHGWGDSTMHLMHLRSARLDPAARHRQARRIGRFDFGCPASMSMDPARRDEIFGAYRDACAEHDEPGRYVPFLAYEAHPRAGDRQVIFRDYAAEPPPPPMRDEMGVVDAAYGDRDDVLLEVHIGGDPPHWDVYEPARERLVEVCSGFGCAEWLLQRALQRGYRPGICAASDLHLGWMGGPRSVETFRGRFGQKYPMRQRDSSYGTGPLTAIRAPELTRGALWDAILARHTYGTSGARMILDLRCGDHRAGDELPVHAGDRLRLRCVVHGCAPLARVDLIAGVHRLHTWEPAAAVDLDEELELGAAVVPGQWLYLRVEQVDGEWGWTGPIYLLREDTPAADPGLPAWNEEDLDLAAVEPGGAEAHLEDLRAYLEREEDAARFTDLTPAGVLDLAVGRCARFFGHWGRERLPLTIRWFYEFEIPKIRFDFGWRDYGAVDENDLGPTLMERYR